MTSEFKDSADQHARMKVVGVGGSGGNAVNRMIEERLDGVEFIAVNTDAQALLNAMADVKIQIGKKLRRGLGSGARPEVGRQAIEENREDVERAIGNADLVFVTCGMGGGTGTGAAPVICQLAREAGALTVGIVTRPFLFEGPKRMRQAEEGIAEMRKNVDTMIIVPSDRVLDVVGRGIPFFEALKKLDEVLWLAIRGISVLISETGLANVDFADVRTIMQGGGSALMGTGIGRGDNRAMKAAHQAVASPLLDNVSISGATGVLVNITGGEDLTLDEVHRVNDIVHDAVGDNAEIIFGAVHDLDVSGEIQVTVIATGLDRPVAAYTETYHAGPQTTQGFDDGEVPLDDGEIPIFIARQMDPRPTTDQLDQLSGTAPSPEPSVIIAWNPTVVDPTVYAEVIGVLGDLARLDGAGGISRVSADVFEGPPSARRQSA